MSTFLCKGCFLEFRKTKQRQNRCEVCAKKRAVKKRLDKNWADFKEALANPSPFQRKD